MKVSKSGVVETKDNCLKPYNEMSSGGSSYMTEINGNWKMTELWPNCNEI